MRTWSALIVLLLFAGLLLSTFIVFVPHGHTTTAFVTKSEVVTVYSTVFRYLTIDKPGYDLSKQLLEQLSRVVPGYEKIEAYHIIVPSTPGTHSYGFAVFWKQGINHTHLIFFHAPDNARYVLDVDSFIQTRFVAAKHIPTVEARIIPRAELTETVITEKGETYRKQWDILPTTPGYPSTPQVDRGGDMVWIISYRPLEEKDYGETLVARYYFLKITVVK